MHHITHRVGIRAPLAQVQQALTTIDGLAGWWTRDTQGQTGVGESITFTFRDHGGGEMGRFVMKVLPPTATQQVRWSVQAGPPEWVGTEVSFALSQQDGQTVLLFAHRDWREQVEFMAHCSMKWATFLLSLRALVEQGRGQPAPEDLKIDNWN